jgi:tryptophanyl-tRNA synthetase
MATDLDPDELKKPNKGGRPAKYSVEKLVEVISKGGMSSGEIYQAYRNESGISERHFKNLLRDAKTRNMIIEQENGWVRA